MNYLLPETPVLLVPLVPLEERVVPLEPSLEKEELLLGRILFRAGSVRVGETPLFVGEGVILLGEVLDGVVVAPLLKLGFELFKDEFGCKFLFGATVVP